jgi:hypothetical protein
MSLLYRVARRRELRACNLRYLLQETRRLHERASKGRPLFCPDSGICANLVAACDSHVPWRLPSLVEVMASSWEHPERLRSNIFPIRQDPNCGYAKWAGKALEQRLSLLEHMAKELEKAIALYPDPNE